MTQLQRRYTFRLADLVSFTTLAAAIAAMALSIEGNLQLGAYLILTGYLLDGVDGEAARRLGGFSEFGTQLDSLIDVVHFGAAVSILVSQHLRAGPVGGWPTWVLLSGYMFASCFRLARFNLAAHAIDKRETVGLTISTSGAFLTMAVLAHLKLTQPSGSDWVLLPMLAGVSLLMVSRVAFPDLKGLPRYRVPTILTFLLGGLVAVWLSLEVGLFTIWAIYVGFGTFRAALRRVTRRTTPLDSRQESVNQRSSA